MSETIQRYLAAEADMTESDEGQYVLLFDHESALAAAQAEVEKVNRFREQDGIKHRRVRDERDQYHSAALKLKEQGDQLAAENAAIKRELEEARRHFAEDWAAQDDALEKAGIEMEDSAGHKVIEQGIKKLAASRDKLQSRVTELEKDRDRLDWLIERGPQDESEMGMTLEIWELATNFADPDDREASADKLAVRKAVDAARSAKG
jgi:hypothetical protein